MKQKTFIVRVRGRGSFPIDMLRYDRMTPRHESDSLLIEHDHFPLEHRTVELLAHNLPTVPRWHSFGWAVTDWEEVR